MERLQEFINGVRSELSKVTWPTPTELRESTVVVLIAVAIFSIFTAVVDRVFSFLIGFVM